MPSCDDRFNDWRGEHNKPLVDQRLRAGRDHPADNRVRYKRKSHRNQFVGVRLQRNASGSKRVEPIPGAPQPRVPRRRPESKKTALPEPAAAPASGQVAPQPPTVPAADRAVKLVLVCGPRGSGTTAIAGLLHRLGAIGMEPYFETSDERTRNSYESMLFWDVLVDLVDEDSLSLRNGAELMAEAELCKFRDRLMTADAAAATVDAVRPIFLKHALSALFLPQICKLFDAKLVYVVRPLDEIEAAAIRRQGRRTHLFAHVPNLRTPRVSNFNCALQGVARRSGATCPYAVRICRTVTEQDRH
jgi:hypothetical protein